MTEGRKWLATHAPGETLPEYDWAHWSCLSDAPYAAVYIGERPAWHHIAIAKIRGEWWYEVRPEGHGPLIGRTTVDAMDTADTSQAHRFEWEDLPEVLARLRVMQRLGGL